MWRLQACRLAHHLVKGHDIHVGGRKFRRGHDHPRGSLYRDIGAVHFDRSAHRTIGYVVVPVVVIGVREQRLGLRGLPGLPAPAQHQKAAGVVGLQLAQVNRSIQETPVCELIDGAALLNAADLAC